jgi:predicted protein tyrosine phosphatase
VEVVVMSEDAVKKYECVEPHVVISIRSPDGEAVELPENPARKGVLRLAFHDVDGPGEEDIASRWLRRAGIAPIPMSRDQAEEVREFVRQNDDVGVVICNCEAGISRSAGVAAALAKTYNGDDGRYFVQYHPNRHAYRMVLDAMQGGSIGP